MTEKRALGTPSPLTPLGVTLFEVPTSPQRLWTLLQGARRS